MLERIKDQLHKKETPYEEYFNQFLMDLQDYNLSKEVNYTINQLGFDIVEMEKLAQEQHERMVDLN